MRLLGGTRLLARVLSVAAGMCLVSGIAGALTASPSGATSYPVVSNIGPRYTTSGGASVLSTTRTVAHWHGSFTDGETGQTYGFNMVGTDPSTETSTTVNTEILPVNFSFEADGGAGFAADTVANLASQSPMFQPTPLPTENAQYVDAVMRSEFNKIGTGYHVLLDNTGILPAVTIDVPSNQGAIYQIPDGTILGLVNLQWFSARMQSLLSSGQYDPTTLPIFFSNDVYLYQKSISACCVIGFHGASQVVGKGGGSHHGNGNEDVLTWAWASWVPSGDIFAPGLTDVAPLSHEASEWAHDPFVDNYVTPWSVPAEPQYGCSNVLETGDPLVGVDFGAGTTNPDPVTGPQWHLQDEAFLWWFSHQPTQASNNEYSYLGTFTSASPGC